MQAAVPAFTTRHDLRWIVTTSAPGFGFGAYRLPANESPPPTSVENYANKRSLQDSLRVKQLPRWRVRDVCVLSTSVSYWGAPEATSDSCRATTPSSVAINIEFFIFRSCSTHYCQRVGCHAVNGSASAHCCCAKQRVCQHHSHLADVTSSYGRSGLHFKLLKNALR